MSRPGQPSPIAAELAASRFQLYFAAFCIDAMNFGLIALISAHAQYSLGAGTLMLGALAVTGRIAYAASAYLVGKQSDRRGSLPLIFTSLIGSALVVPCGLLVSTLYALFLFNIVTRVLLGFFWSPLERHLSLVSPRGTLWNAIGALNLWWAAGAMAGYFVIPALYSSSGPAVALLVCSGLVVVPLAWFVARPPRAHDTESHIPHEDVDAETAELFVRLARVANFCAWAVVGALPFFLLYAARAHGISLPTVGALLATSQLTQLVSFVWLWKSPRWHYSLGWLVATQLLAAGAMTLCGVATEALHFFVLLGVFGVFSGVSYYSSLFYSLNLRHQEGRATGLHESILALGASFGPLGCAVVGFFFPHQPSSPLFFLGGLLVLGAGLQVFLYRRATRG